MTGTGYRNFRENFLSERRISKAQRCQDPEERIILRRDEKGRFEPSQPLAAALYPEEYDKYISFELEDERTIRYLKCETLNADVETEGIHLIGTGRFPLGWGKVKKAELRINTRPAGDGCNGDNAVR